MNKSELIRLLAEERDMAHEDAAKVVNTFFESMKEALKNGDRIEIRGFGSFKIKEYEGYVGRNPRTGEKVDVKSKRLPFFRVGKELREYLNS
ncbi:MAG: HU family DNA-binding protein [Desulfonatronovibrionaceae bacterium]